VSAPAARVRVGNGLTHLVGDARKLAFHPAGHARKLACRARVVLALTILCAAARSEAAAIPVVCERRATVESSQDPRSTSSQGNTPVARATGGIDEAARQALERGLEWLEAAQARASDGAFPSQGARTTSAGTGPAAEVGGHAPVAVTALGALAWMAAGSSPDRGPHGRACTASIEWLVARTDVDPRSERTGYVARHGDTLSRMHGHGFATLALAQAYAMSPHTPRGARVFEALKAAVRCIEMSQGVEGGWDYEPRKGLAHENSITITAVQALRAAKEAGIEVDRAVIARAVDYVGRTQKPDGSFRYALGDASSSVALTAAAIATFQMTGTYEGRPLVEGYDFIARRLALRADGPATIEGDLIVCPFYERFYLAQALWQHADVETWKTWWKSEAPRVLGSQKSDGSWSDPRFGDVYATAMNCLVLALPEGMLPIFQR